MDREAIIRKYLPQEDGLQKTVISAMNYSINAGGKRVRPTMMEEAYRLFGGQERVIEPFMAAIEMIHTYSLVHDDLPAMDNDRLRRGKPTTWAVYGEAMGILAGDGLLTYAFETAARGFEMTVYPDRAARAIGVLARKAGISGMLGGQAVDVELTGTQIPEETLDFIYRLKTGALLEASLMIGGILGGADSQQTDTLEQIASRIGLAFQIRDDILDVTGTEAELGKPIGSDERNIKTTYVAWKGVDQAEREVERLSAEAVELLAGLPGNTEFFAGFVHSLEHRRK